MTPQRSQALLLPADVLDSAGLIASDLELERARQTLRSLAAAASDEPLLVDFGDRGRTAVETATWLVSQGVREARLGILRSHHAAAAVLCTALRDAGLEVQLLDLPATAADHDDAVDTAPPLHAQRDAGATELVIPGRGATPPDRPSPCHPALLDPSSDVALPAWTDYVARHRPELRAAWQRLLITHDCGLCPRLQIYAGNSLRDRNRDLLVNIVPGTDSAETGR